MGNRRHRRSQARNPIILLGVGVLAVGVIGLTGFAIASSNIPTPAEAREYVAPPVTATYTPIPKPEQRRMAEVLPRLDDEDDEFTIVVFGDSTGVSSKGWQVLVPQWLGERYDRPVTLHPWNRDDERYDQAWGLGSGSNAPITVWNASSPGRPVAFAQEHQADMVPIAPEDVDLVFMNFGHTERPDAAVQNVSWFSRDVAAEYKNAAVVYLKQNPDHSKSPLRGIQKMNAYRLETWAENYHFDSIPIYDAFEATGRVDELMDEPTLIHPNDAGYRVWADAMIKRLKEDGA